MRISIPTVAFICSENATRLHYSGMSFFSVIVEENGVGSYKKKGGRKKRHVIEMEVVAGVASCSF